MADGANVRDGKPAVEDPAKVAQELLKAENEVAKAEAEAETAKLARDKAAQERAEAESPLSDAKRAADNRKAIAAADQDAAASRQKQLAALIPDLSKIEGGGKLETSEGPVLFGPTLAQRALTAAASEVAEPCLEKLNHPPGEWRLLVTTDAELATTDAVYQDVLAGITQMHRAMEPLLPLGKPAEPQPKAIEDRGPKRLLEVTAMPGLVDGAVAIAGALPTAISLLLPRRTLSRAPFGVDDTAATAAVIGALESGNENGFGAIVHDGFRLLPEGGTVLARLGELETRRQELAGHRLLLEDARTEAAADMAACEEKIKALSKKLEAASKADKDQTAGEIAAEKVALAGHQRKVNHAVTRIGLIENALTAVDGFVNALRTAPADSPRSPLSTALLREQLHPAEGKKGGFTHTLLVEAEEGSAQQVLDDRRFRADRVSAIGAVNVSYMLIEVATSEVRAAGVVSGSGTVTGKIGSKLELDPKPWPRWRWRRSAG